MNYGKFAFLSAVSLVLAACGDNAENPPPVQEQAQDAAAEAQPEAGAEAAPEAAPDAPAEAQPPEPDAEAPKPDPECATVADLEAVVLFKAPQPRGDGYLAAAAQVYYASLATKPNVEWADPFPGCVAKTATEQELACDFGQAYPGTVITFIFGLNEHGGPTEKLGAWFSFVNSDETISYYGEYYACKGKKLVGSFKDGKFEGALAPTGYPDNADLDFTVP